MKKRKNHKAKQPKYITIRIQYYPVNQKIYFLLSLCIIFFFGVFVQNYSKSHRIGEYTKVLPTAIYVSSLSPDKQVSDYKKYEVVSHGDRSKKEIALTFDADMTPDMKLSLQSGEVISYYNKPVIDILNSTQTKATLFLTGMWIETYPDAAAELARNQLFELGSHSYSHPGFDGDCYGLRQISDDEDEREIQKTQRLLKDISGIDTVLFRFPGGCHSQVDVDQVHKNGLQAIQWDVAGQDGFNEDTVAIEENVLSNVKNGSIIVLHMHGGPNAPKTAEALPTIIARLKEQGYTFVTVSELLSLPSIIKIANKNNFFTRSYGL